MHPGTQHLWQPLESEAVIDIIAPGYGAPRDLLKRAAAAVEAMGFTPRAPEDIFGKDVLSSNTDEYRARHLAYALTNKESCAVWALRGGYGATRLLGALARLKPPAAPKILIGYSDITALHCWLNQRWGWPSLHAPVLAEMTTPKSAPALKEIARLLGGSVKECAFSRLRPMNAAARKKHVISAPVLGGNLSLLQASLGTRWAFAPEGAVIFMEEVDERGYRIDRMLMHLAQAGVFTGARAVVFGDITGGAEKDGSTLAPKALGRFAESLEIPVLKGLPCGHGAKNRPLPLGTRALLETGMAAKLICPLPFGRE